MKNRKRRAGMLLFLLCLMLSAGNVHGDSSKSAASASALPAPVLKKAACASWNSIKVTWSAVKGASGYYVYRRENKKWVRIGSTKTTSFTHKSSSAHKIEPGISYTYTVCAYQTVNGKKVKGRVPKTTLKASTYLPKISGLQAEAANSTSIRLSWNQMEGADYYRVYRKNSAGKWKSVKTLKGSVTSYTHKASASFPIEAETQYVYTVKALAKTSAGTVGGKVYSGVKVTTPERNAYEKFSKVYMVGHSRALGMQAAVTDKVPSQWLCKVSAGYAKFSGEYMPAISGSLNGSSAVIIMMGLNDLYNQKNYISYINSHIDSWTASGARIYFVNVGPVDYDPYCTNAEIAAFNAALKQGLSSKVKYIDVYGYLTENGYTTTDGAHYNEATYRREYDYIMENL